MPTASHDNPVLTTDMSKKTYLKGETCGNDVMKKRSDRNSEPKNGVFFVPVSPPRHTYIVSNVPERNINAYQNGINNVRPEKTYDPYEHYVERHPTTFLDSVVHYMKVGMGAGVLAMPNAFRNAGWLLGSILTFAVGLLCTYTIHILIEAEYELCKRRRLPNMTQAETVEYALKEGPQCLRWLAPYGKFLADFFMVVYQLGSSAIYIVFIASNFKQVHDTYCGSDINIRLLMVYLVIPLVLIGWVRTLKLLAPLSTIADVAVLVSFGLIFMYIFDDLPPLSERVAIGEVRSVPLFFGTVMFAMEAIGVVMPLKNSMREPQKFGGLFGVINASMLPIMLLYAFLGFFGYLKYGQNAEGSITLNLPKDDILADIAKIMHSSSMYISYALSNFIIFDVVWTNGMKDKFTGYRYKIIWEYAVRSGIAVITIIMAIAIPNLETFISLTGSFCLSVLALAVPAVVHGCTYWNDRSKPLTWALLQLRNLLLLLLAVFAFVVGVSSAIIEYMEHSKR